MLGGGGGGVGGGVAGAPPPPPPQHSILVTMKEKWLTVHVVHGMEKAVIIKGRLESEGIPVELKYEAIGKLYGITVNGIGEIKILVPPDFYDEAKSIIEEAEGKQID